MVGDSPNLPNSPPRSDPIPTPSVNRPPERRSRPTHSRATVRSLPRPAAGQRRDHGAETNAVRPNRCRRQGDPWVPDRELVTDRNVIPYEQAVPPSQFGSLRQLTDEPGVGERPEVGYRQAESHHVTVRDVAKRDNADVGPRGKEPGSTRWPTGPASHRRHRFMDRAPRASSAYP